MTTYTVLYMHPNVGNWVSLNMGLPMSLKDAKKAKARLTKKGCTVNIIRK